MREKWFFGTLVLILCTVNLQIAGKETLKRDGARVLLSLTPRDPRSIMQGDYMALYYAIAADASRNIKDRSNEDGHLVIRCDERRVASLVRFHHGGALAAGEQLLRYRRRGWRMGVGGETYFFQEGEAKRYERARFGEMRVSPDGDALLTGLCDERGEPI